MHLASGYDLIQEEALMIALRTSEKKREVYRSYPLSARILPNTRKCPLCTSQLDGLRVIAA